MNHLGYQYYYQRNRPHIQPEGCEVFATFRLAGSVPRPVLARWREDRKRLLDALERSPTIEERARRQLAMHRAWFARMEACLDAAQTGPQWLNEPDVAQVVVDALHHLDDKKYHLLSHTVMPNHVHVLFAPRPITPTPTAEGHSETALTPEQKDHSLASIMHSLKGYTSTQCNRVLKRTGPFWEHESYDHFVRDENDEGRIVEYILNNPVKAGLVSRWEEWPWNFWRGAER